MGEAASAGREKLVDASSCEIEWTEDSDRFYQSTSTAILMDSTSVMILFC